MGVPPDILDSHDAGGLVFRGGMLRVAGFVAGTLLSLGGVAVLTRHLGVSGYGRYQTVVSMIAQVVADAGMTTLGIQEYAQRSGESRDRLMRVLLGLRLLVTSVGVLVGAALVAVAGFGLELVAGTLLMGAGLVVVLLQTTAQIPLTVGLRLRAVTAIELVRQTLAATGIAVLVLAGAGLLPFLAVTIPVHLVILVITIVLVRGTIPLRPSFSRAEWGLVRRPAAVGALAVSVGVTYLYAGQILVAIVGSEREAGLYSAAFRVFVIVAAVPAILASSAFPVLARAARDDRARLAGATRSLFDASLVLGGAAAVGCVLGAGAIVRVVGGDAFGDAAGVLRIQGAVLLLTFVLPALGFTLLALQRYRTLVVANATGFALVAVLVPVLVAAHGAEGAAVATLIGEAALIAGYLFALIRQDTAYAPALGSTARVLAVLGVSLATGLVSGLPPAWAAVVGLAIYGAGIVLTGTVPAPVREQLRRRP